LHLAFGDQHFQTLKAVKGRFRPMERARKEDYPAYTGDAPFVNVIRTHMTFKGRSPKSKSAAPRDRQPVQHSPDT
jgi:hypothetical protein